MERIPSLELQRRLLRWRESHLFQLPTKLVTPPGAIKTLEALITSGADLAAVEQKTPCIPYVFWDPDLIRFFLKRGRDINAQDYAGNTALHLAALNNRQPAIKFLLKHNADPNAKNKKGNTPLWNVITAMRCVRIQQFGDSSKTFKKLLKATIDMNVRNGEGLTYLHAGMQVCFYHFGDAIKQLVNRFPDVNIRSSKSSFGKTPLMAACEDDNPNLCQLLIKKQADVNAKDIFGWTALHYAMNYKDEVPNYACIKILLSSGAEARSILDFKTITGSFHISNFMRRYEPLICDETQYIDLFEMTGAYFILLDDFKTGLDNWKKAFIMRAMWGYPREASSDSRKSTFKVENEILTERDLDNTSFKTQDDIAALYRHAILVTDRITNGSSWILMEALTYLMDKYNNFNETKFLVVKDLLPRVIEKMTNQEMESFEHEFITNSFFSHFKLDGSFPESRDRFKSLLSINPQFFLKLIVAPFKWWIDTYGNNVPKNQLENISRYIASIDELTERGFVSSEISTPAMKTLVELDPRDEEGNGLLHFACRKFGKFDMSNLLINLGANVRAENSAGVTPLEQLLSSPLCGEYGVEETQALVLRMLSKKAHIDFQVVPRVDRNLQTKLPGFNLQPYISLQCLSATVLVKSNVKYRTLLPKSLTEFVDKHFYE